MCSLFNMTKFYLLIIYSGFMERHGASVPHFEFLILICCLCILNTPWT